MDNKEIASYIKARRKKLKVGQQDLADMAGIGINTLVALERAQGNPKLSTLLSVADILGLQLDLRLKD
ncbi:MAG: helix-turn-helix domain-containing protein [Bacteroidales bacterium]|nr:helix-turn-helix domain-containing protein [Bacteroidales bacterium]